ncbi:hypothetical protein BGM30_45360 [Microcystis aeruginosa NIES-298]|uniref:Uncharacterized protein n=1 Tax=Microcystis aeruginosa NIES-298 TaxID=449468 RepID=A0A9P2YP55_MICAE|nr:hypothetical protein BGM30_45360 [Microcystis aeruginosa NIES-298]
MESLGMATAGLFDCVGSLGAGWNIQTQYQRDICAIGIMQ